MIDLEIDKLFNNPNKQLAIAQALGPGYEVFGRTYYSVPELCETAWIEGDIPLIHGRHGIGKSGVLVPYLRNLYPNVKVVDEDEKIEDMSGGPINRVVVVASFKGAYGDTNQLDLRDTQNTQLKRLAYYGGIPIPFKGDGGELLFKTTVEHVQDVARAAFSDHPHFDEAGLVHWRFRRGFQRISDMLNDNSKSHTLRPALANLIYLAQDAEFFRKRVFGFF